MWLRRSDVQPLLDDYGLDATAVQIDGDLRPRSHALNGAAIDYTEYLENDRKTVRNVVGILPGMDPARVGEAIVIGAHYDHVGLGGRLGRWRRSARVEIQEWRGRQRLRRGIDYRDRARRYSAAAARFPRTLIFVTFAGEERGLLGSERYVAAPPIPLVNTVAMLNLDMVGRARGSVDVSGLDMPAVKNDLMAASQRQSRCSTSSRKVPAPAAATTRRSSTARVPAVNFFTGFHPDYHRPSDDWEKIVKQEQLQGWRRLALRVRRPAGCRTRVYIENAGVEVVEVEAGRERLQPLAQHQPSAVQTRLECLILHVQPRAGFLGAQSLDIPQHHRRAVDFRQLLNRREDRAPQLRAQHRLIRHVGPVRRLAWRGSLLVVLAIALVLLSLPRELLTSAAATIAVLNVIR